MSERAMKPRMMPMRMRPRAWRKPPRREEREGAAGVVWEREEAAELWRMVVVEMGTLVESGGRSERTSMAV